MEAIEKITYALSSRTRLSIVKLLCEETMVNVTDIATRLNLPLSTISNAIKHLQQAGIVGVEFRTGMRGMTKLCWIKTSRIHLFLKTPYQLNRDYFTCRMPIGGYSEAKDIQPTCGMLGESDAIGVRDNPAVFYSPGRFDAQMIWFKSGTLEYRLAETSLPLSELNWIEISFEACSEAPMHKSPWKSDICVWVNDVLLGVWTSPCDCGGRHGAYTPIWWSDVDTQFGYMKVWRIDHTGSYLDQTQIGQATIEDVVKRNRGFLSVRIGVPADAKHVGGMNLFGERFGDYAQGLIIRAGIGEVNSK